MSTQRHNVPIVGQTNRIVVHTITIVIPNAVDVKAGGLDCGDSIAYLAITNPIKGEQMRVPINRAQADEIVRRLDDIVSADMINAKQQEGNRGIH